MITTREARTWALIDAPPAPDNSDLNADGHVNISDLALVGSNFGLTGPLPGK